MPKNINTVATEARYLGAFKTKLGKLCLSKDLVSCHFSELLHNHVCFPCSDNCLGRPKVTEKIVIDLSAIKIR